jgi:hypothetical protein
MLSRVMRSNGRPTVQRIIPATTEWVLRDLRELMLHTRAAQPAAPRSSTSLRELLSVVINRGVTSGVIRRLRNAAAKSASRSR